jgi:lysozyme family protein
MAKTKTASASSAYPPEFTSAVEQVLGDEGGFEERAGDRGGLTKYGISAREYPNVDVYTLTRDGAIAIYFRDWWQRFRFERLPAPLAAKCFDLAVNMGATHAIVCLQRALRACGKRILQDGNLGEQTVAASSAIESTALLAALRSEAAGYYRMLAQTQGRQFLDGWLNRAYR